MSNALVVDTTIPTPTYGQARAVPAPPIPGVVDLIDARALSYPVGAALHTYPNLVAQGGVYARDAVHIAPGGATATVQAVAGRPVLQSIPGGGKLGLAAEAGSAPGACTLVWAGIPCLEAATGTFGSACVSLKIGTTDTLIYNTAGGKATLTHAGATLTHSRVINDGGFHVLIAVLNGTKSRLFADGLSLEGTLAATPAGTRYVLNGEGHKASPGASTFHYSRLERAITDAEARLMTDWLTTQWATP